MKHTLFRPGDQSGAYTYRIAFPQMAMKSIFKAKTMRFSESTHEIQDINFIKTLHNIVYQKPASPGVTGHLGWIKTASDNIGFKLVMDYDDILNYKDLPSFNSGTASFKPEIVQNGIKFAVEIADILIFTTAELRDYYIENYNIQKERCVIIPNYIPRWWMHPNEINRQTQIFMEQKRKRILLPLSDSHYSSDINLEDDLTHICNFIRNTCKKYEWIFVNRYPLQLRDLAISKRITIIPGSNILNYPREMIEIAKPSLILAPLQDSVFNNCKSEIKLIEAYGMGVPIIAQDLKLYNKLTDYVFKDENDLQNQIDRVFKSKQNYQKLLKTNSKLCNTGTNALEEFKHGFWLENNIHKHIDVLIKTNKKTIKLNLDKLNEKI